VPDAQAPGPSRIARRQDGAGILCLRCQSAADRSPAGWPTEARL